ncbi:serine/threonine-protein kinase [Polyangium sp. 15x6]|uniref:serine/threonine-protein kinase n=1 Tax=Polyangium sp. 15x6 TaxID=3042687 RepID=UPI00249CF1DF|nr:serine/threonine-protein kinase [Polyangium sp. 15x6]MDI3281978.1 protein kinase [Polyangium sp. 15x6]
MVPEFSQASDRFLIEGRAGSGGMGDIYKATDQLTGQEVALKILRDSATPQERVRFMREIAILADLRHPNIVQYVTHGTWNDGRLFFAMEWLDGEDLGQRQRRAPLGMRDAVEVVRRSAAAMAAIHARNVVHRDLKLSNIFLVRGKGTAIKLIDFGVVKPPVPDEYQTERGTIIGTPHFMAPEQARGEPIDERADVYSLGAVLFRLVTGRNVFETEHVIALLGRLVLEDPPNPQSIRFDVPEALAEVILRSVARSREDRFENSGELARALARVGQLSNDPPAADRSSASAVRAVPGQKPITITDAGAPPVPASRPGSAERRVVASVLFDLAGARLGADVHQKLRDVLGDDTRLEPLLDQQMVAVLGVEHSRGDEVMRAARAALVVTQALPTARAAVAIGLAIRGRANLAGQALERAVGQIELASPGTVRVDSHAASALEGRFVLQPDARGGVLLREDTSGFVARQLLGRPTPTVGREKEIALLQGIYGELLEDATPRGALVLGAVGIGKSRVRSELVQRLEVAPVRPELLICRGDSLSQTSSLSALGRALRAVMGLQDGEAPAEQVLKVRRHVATRLPPAQRFVAGFLGELVGVTFPDQDDEPLRAARASAELMQARLRMALEAYFRAEADRAPQVLVLEDVHWADDTTLEMVDWLLGCADIRFAVFAFGRTELATRLRTLWERRNITRVWLAPLSPLAADRLVSAALPGMDAATRANLVKRADGNALFLEELVRCAAEGRNELPLTVQAVVQLRLDRMSSKVREVLRAASVFGQSFWTGGVTALVGRSVGLELSELYAAEIVARQPESRIAGEDEWIFRQALVRDAAYEAILDEDRAALHLAAGNWLESVGDVDAGLIARHADAGGAHDRAARLYARATKQAYTNGAQLETALDLANRGLACGAAGDVRVQLLVARAQFSIFMGRLLDGIAAAEEAAQLARGGSDMWGEAQRLAAAALIESGRAAEGDDRAAKALTPPYANTLSPPIRASLLAVRVRGLVDRLQPGEAMRVANDAVEAARASGASDALVRALDARLFAIAHMNDPSEVVTTGASLIEVAESISDIAFATRGRLNVGSALNHLGMFEEAQSMLERALFDARARRMRILEAFALHNLGMSYARLGNLDLGIDHQRQAARIADETNAARLRVNTRIYETIFLVWRGAPGDLATALSLARWAIEETRAQPALQVLALFALSRVQLARRAVDAAVETARDANARLASAPVEEWEEGIRVTLIEALLSVGEDDEANAVLDAAFTALEERVRTIRMPHHREAFVRRNEEVYRIVQYAYHRLGRYFQAGT